MWHVTCDMWHVTRDKWHVTRDMFGRVNILSKFQLPSSYRLWLWYDEDLEEKDDLPNEWMNYEAVYRTAPATPGLLINTIQQNSYSYLLSVQLSVSVDWYSFMTGI